MRFLVAFHTIGGRREVHRPGRSSLLDACVAFEAVDPLHDVCTVLERSVLFLLLEAQHLGAGPCRAGK
jgi:hypothetical protein